MPEKYRVTAPDGKVLILTGPPGASPDEVMARAKAMYKPQDQGNRIPSGIGAEQMTDATGVSKAPLTPVGGPRDFLALAGLPSDLSQLKQAFTPEAMAKTLIPGYNVKNALQSYADIPSNLMSGDFRKILMGLGLGGVAGAAPTVATVGRATKGAMSSALAKSSLDPMDLYRSANDLRGGTPPKKLATGAIADALDIDPLLAGEKILRLAAVPAKRGIASIKERLADALVDYRLKQSAELPQEFVQNAPDIPRAPRQATATPYTGNAMERVEVPPAAPYQDPAAMVQSAPQQPRLRKVASGEPYAGNAMERNLPPTPPEPAVPDVSTIERGLAPSGGRAKLSTLRNAPKLADEVPELAGLQPGPEFDNALMQGFRRTEAMIEAAEDAVPSYTAVSKSPVIDQWKEIAADYKARGLETSAGKVESLIKEWEKLPDDIPWKSFLNRKRSFFKEGGLNSTPIRKAYRALMDASGKISKDLSAANSSYHIVRKGLDDAKIDPITGRRIMAVGQSTPLADAFKKYRR